MGEEVIIIPAIFLCVVAIVKVVSDNNLKKRLIERGLVDERVKFLEQASWKARRGSNLKWGLVLVGIGVAAMASWFFPRDIHEEGTLGLMFLLAGAGFLIYYFVAPKIEDDDNK